MFSVCVANQTRLEPEWLPREENTQANLINKIIDYDDWRLVPALFADLEKWGVHTIARFTDAYNRQVPHFNSRFFSSGSEAVDAFTCHWEKETNWCPPIHLINRVSQHARKTIAH